jgi:hypothetical protein
LVSHGQTGAWVNFHMEWNGWKTQFNELTCESVLLELFCLIISFIFLCLKWDKFINICFHCNIYREMNLK